MTQTSHLSPASSPNTPAPCSALPLAPDPEATLRLFALVESELGLPAGTVHAATPTDTLGDSLDWLELLMAVEEAFGVEIDPARAAAVTTVGDLLRLLPAPGGATPQAGLGDSVPQALDRMAAPWPLSR